MVDVVKLLGILSFYLGLRRLGRILLLTPIFDKYSWISLRDETERAPTTLRVVCDTDYKITSLKILLWWTLSDSGKPLDPR